MIKGWKGFNKDLKCRGMQYEIGKTFEEPEAEACEKGLHFCEYPLDVLGYYPPADSRYAEVEADGEIDRDGQDSKVATTRLHIKAEIGLPGLIKAGVDFIKSKVDWDNAKESNTGNRSASTNTGNRSAATNTGNRSAATNTGNWSAATNTGNRSAATNTGDWSAATNTGDDSKAKGSLGSAIVVVERGDWNGDTYPLIAIKSAIVDGESIKADTFYKLQNGEFVEVE
ncbi:hypothetical protein BK140_33355 [Paenibacillus macerans]|nr:hypothetical protein BK140_33355 [Paenibacillus macerans]